MKQIKEKVFLCFCGLLAGVIVAEIALRILGIGYPEFWGPDQYCGTRLRPEVKGYWLEEGGGYVSINSDGLRDREHSIAKPPDTLRIAVLGDSYAAAFEVNREQTFWSILERKLSENAKVKGRRQVEVINFGQSGFGLSQELQALRHRVWKYTPDIILLTFFIGNDVSDNSPMLRDCYYHPYFIYKGDELVLVDEHIRKHYEERRGWWNDFRIWVFNGSRVLQVLDRARITLHKWSARKRQKRRAVFDRDGEEPGLHSMVYIEPKNEEWRQAWRVTEGLLLLMRDEVRKGGALFFVVILSDGKQVHPDPAFRENIKKGLSVKDLFYPDLRIKGLCEREGIPVLALAPFFQKYATQHKVFLHGFGSKDGKGHWNEKGHRLAGDMIAKWLCEKWSG